MIPGQQATHNTSVDFLFSREYGTFARFCQSLDESLKAVLYQPSTPTTNALATSILQSDIAGLVYRQENIPPVGCPFEGAEVVSAKAFQANENALGIQWDLKPYPFSRFDDVPNAMTLGRYEEFDLWIGFQEAIGDTLIAKYGKHPSEYISFNAGLYRSSGIDALMWALYQIGPYMEEAFHRAIQMGYLREWAE